MVITIVITKIIWCCNGKNNSQIRLQTIIYYVLMLNTCFPWHPPPHFSLVVVIIMEAIIYIYFLTLFLFSFVLSSAFELPRVLILTTHKYMCCQSGGGGCDVHTGAPSGECHSWHTSGQRAAPTSTKRWPNVDLMLGQRRRRWPSIKSTLVTSRVF